MAKVKRYNNNGYVTSDDSNSGMKEAYDEGALERANSSKESQAIANEAKGEGMLKSMRDAVTKPKIVTKEELAASGMSLRDYMNKQQGLSRRGESRSDIAAIIAKGQANNDADRKETEAEEVRDRAMNQKLGAFDQNSATTYNTPNANSASKSSSGMSMKDKVTKEAIDSIKASGKKYPDMSALQAPAKRAGMTAMGRKDSGFDLNSNVSYKKGGSVSSASRRADGIATKGKTRGRMC